MRKNLDGGLLHAMHAFLKVIDSGSFTAAAEQMDLDHSTGLHVLSAS